MGYCADTVDSHFIIPEAEIPAALDAVNTLIANNRQTIFPDWGPVAPCAPYQSLAEAIESETSFESCEQAHGIFMLGWHGDKWFEDRVEAILAVLAPHAEIGSYVRMCGEDGSLWGYEVIIGGDGQKTLALETGRYEWSLDRFPTGEPVTYSAAAATRLEDGAGQAGA